MNIENSLAELQSLKDTQAKELQEATSKIQADFEKYISDKTVPLQDRWHTFTHAPEELSDIIDVYPNLHYEEVSQGLEFFQDELMLHMIDFHNQEFNLKNKYPLHFDENGEIDLKLVKMYLEDNCYKDEQLKQLIIDGAEDILTKNLMSFVCDS